MFPSGEFSQITRVSKRLLHYYDEIGLLIPARIDPHTGYRYYSARQLPLLKFQMGRIGVQSLEELKYYVERDQVHPRKLKAQQKQVRKEAPAA